VRIHIHTRIHTLVNDEEEEDDAARDTKENMTQKKYPRERQARRGQETNGSYSVVAEVMV
jgi:hypothetical protein